MNENGQFFLEFDDDSIGLKNYSLYEYNIGITPYDYNIETLFNLIEKRVISVPDFQRYYVWDIDRASAFIESIISDIPVPQMFLYQREKSKFLIIDGQQRMLSIYYFSKGRFPKIESRGILRKILNETGYIPREILMDNNYFRDFRLKVENSALNDISFLEMAQQEREEFALKTIRCTMIKSLETEKEKEIILLRELFKRLNTGGMELNPQEIRSSLYRCEFYNMLNRINLLPDWRNLIGLPYPHFRMDDIKSLLRGFAFLSNREKYKDTPNPFLDDFSKDAMNYSLDEVKFLEELFIAFLQNVSEIKQGDLKYDKGAFNLLIYESVFVAMCKKSYLEKKIDVCRLPRAKLDELKLDADFVEATKTNQSHMQSLIDQRLNRADTIING